MRMRRTARAVGVLFVLAIAMLEARAEFPLRTVRIVVPYMPGGMADLQARALAEELGRKWTRGVVVENRPGAGGTISAQRVVQSRADGYTLLIGGANNMVLAPLLRRDLAYAPTRDLVPLGGIARVPYGIAVATHVDVADLRELVAHARARPGRLAFGSSGIGSSSHLAIAMLCARADLEMLHVPFRGSPVALNELVSGRIDVLAADLALLLPQARRGKLRLVAVTGPHRAEAAPGVPTVAEQGLPGYAVEPWYALYAPSATPREAVDAVAQALAGALRQGEVPRMLAAQGYEPLPLSAQAIRSLMHDERLRYEAVVDGIDAQDAGNAREPRPGRR